MIIMQTQNCHLLLKKTNIQRESVMFLLQFIQFQFLSIVIITLDQEIAVILVTLRLKYLYV